MVRILYIISGYRIIRCYNTAIELYAYESVHHIKTVKDFLRQDRKTLIVKITKFNPSNSNQRNFSLKYGLEILNLIKKKIPDNINVHVTKILLRFFGTGTLRYL